MSAPVTRPVAALHSVDTSADTARVWVDSAAPDRAALKIAAKIAAGALHTIVGKPLTVTPDGQGAAYVVYPAIRTRRASAEPVAPEPVAAPEPVDPVAALTAQVAALQAQLAALTGGAAPAAAPAAPREVPAFIARARAVTCRTCRDHGVVRGVGANAGKPYRTADGAKAAKAAGRTVKCPSHTRTRKSA
jgi:hypothetical protein